MIRILALFLSAAAGLAAPTFTRDVAPLVFANCSGCHRPGQSAPFSLLSYQDVARRARQIVEVTGKKVMPPWLPDPAYGHYEGERLLSAGQIQLLADWAAAGAPEGDPAQLPKLPEWTAGWTLGQPDLVVQTPVFTVPAEGKDVYRNFAVAVPTAKTQYVAAVEFDPGNRRVAHHAFIRLDRTRTSRDLDAADPLPGFDGMDSPPTAQSPDGHFLSWQPGKRPSRNPDGLSWRLYPNSDLVLQMHLQPSGKPEPIQSSIAFYFTEKPPTRFPLKVVLTSYKMDVPPGEAHYEVTNSFKVPVDLDVLGVLPHAHYLGRDLQGYVKLPDGSTNWLLRIPDWNFAWQGDYRFKTPVFAPKGSTIFMRFLYDNSTNNPHNPHNPPVRVRYGVQTVDEMAELWLQVLPRNPEGLAPLREEVEKQTVDYAIDFAEYRLRLNPNDAKAHVKYAQAMFAQGKSRRALPHLQAAAQADPAYDEPHYYMGILARMENRPGIAIQHFKEAVRLNPRNAKAFGNLGLIYFDQGNFPESEKSFRAAVEIDPGDAIAHDRLGVIYYQDGKRDRAAEHFRAAVEADPSDSEFKGHLALVQGQGSAHSK